MNQSKRIVLIDDDQLNNMINTRIITKFSDYKVDAFINAREALRHLAVSIDKDEFPEIIFLDINMPIMDGWEFLDELEKFPRQITANCYVIMLTSSIDIDDIERSKLYKSVREFMSKPLTLENLRHITQVTKNA